MGWDPHIDIINCYGTYVDRSLFYEKVGQDGLMKVDNIILGGDLNLNLLAR